MTDKILRRARPGKLSAQELVFVGALVVLGAGAGAAAVVGGIL
jgi:hypothetical protein